MNQSPTRRGVFRAFLAVLFGSGVSAVAGSSSPPPHCRHYDDGVVWAARRTGSGDHYLRDPEGCPFCRAAESRKRRAQAPRTSSSSVTTYVYDIGHPPYPVTTTHYDALGRVIAVEDHRPPQAPA